MLEVIDMEPMGKTEFHNEKTVVLTGAGGFLGRNLLPAMLNQGIFVCAVSSKSREDLCKLAGVSEANERLTVISQSDRLGVLSALSNVDYLINMGFPRDSDGYRIAEAMEYASWLFREAILRGAKSVVNISSQSVYDQYRTEPAAEESLACPQSLYAVAKYATELMLNNACANIPHTNIRLSSLIGPGFDQRVVNRMVDKAFSEKQIVASDQTGQFGYLDVLDAVAGICKLIDIHPSRWSEIINLGSCRGVSMAEIAEIVKEKLSLLGIAVNVHYSDANNSKLNTTVNSSTIMRMTGWKPLFSLEDTTKRIVDLYLHRGIPKDAGQL